MDTGEVTDNSRHRGTSELHTLPGDCLPRLHTGLALGARSQFMAFTRCARTETEAVQHLFEK